jgi:hypothetical protein
MDLSSFVMTQNVIRFTDQLQSEMDASRRQQLQRLLIEEEEDRLGFSYEQLENVEQEIAKAGERIEFQRARVETILGRGRDATIAKSLLENLIQIQTIYKQYRRMILAALDRSGL